MSHSERERHQRHQQIRQARLKLDGHRIPAEGREANKSTRGEREWRDLVDL